MIFTAFRSGIAPLGGAGGAGVVISRLADGCKLVSTYVWADKVVQRLHLA